MIRSRKTETFKELDYKYWLAISQIELPCSVLSALSRLTLTMRSFSLGHTMFVSSPDVTMENERPQLDILRVRLLAGRGRRRWIFGQLGQVPEHVHMYQRRDILQLKG